MTKREEIKSVIDGISLYHHPPQQMASLHQQQWSKSSGIFSKFSFGTSAASASKFSAAINAKSTEVVSFAVSASNFSDVYFISVLTSDASATVDIEDSTASGSEICSLPSMSCSTCTLDFSSAVTSTEVPSLTASVATLSEICFISNTISESPAAILGSLISIFETFLFPSEIWLSCTSLATSTPHGFSEFPAAATNPESTEVACLTDSVSTFSAICFVRDASAAIYCSGLLISEFERFSEICCASESSSDAQGAALHLDSLGNWYEVSSSTSDFSPAPTTPIEVASLEVTVPKSSEMHSISESLLDASTAVACSPSFTSGFEIPSFALEIWLCDITSCSAILDPWQFWDSTGGSTVTLSVVAPSLETRSMSSITTCCSVSCSDISITQGSKLSEACTAKDVFFSMLHGFRETSNDSTADLVSDSQTTGRLRFHVNIIFNLLSLCSMIPFRILYRASSNNLSERDLATVVCLSDCSSLVCIVGVCSFSMPLESARGFVSGTLQTCAKESFVREPIPCPTSDFPFGFEIGATSRTGSSWSSSFLSTLSGLFSSTVTSGSTSPGVLEAEDLFCKLEQTIDSGFSPRAPFVALVLPTGISLSPF
nr:hypothetical protein Iba_chr07bCG9890 [Ipomoea batatas]